VSGIRVGRRSHARLEHLLAAARQDELTYGHPGSTLHDPARPGANLRSVALDTGGDLDAATATLRRWATHAGIGAYAYPPGVEPADGETVLIVVPFGPVEMVVPNRIVTVVDEADRFGYAYGTLPGHQESGEEAFVAQRTAPDRLRLEVRIDARPATLLTRIGGPIAARVQHVAARRYLQAWAAAIAAEPG
jgi:uncharacterized protein (UPF0548 family)